MINMHKQCLIFNLLCLFQVKFNTRQIETQDIIKAFKGSRHAQTLNVYGFQIETQAYFGVNPAIFVYRAIY